ncbi:MAG: ATP-grasp domain-containing protein, partial [Lachnospiraceae bacterium]|nr:ATP-grasp domain-containing protein [Lachnospiraceae bacterium]
VVVKPPHGAGSMGVRFCDTREEVIERFTEQSQKENFFGEMTPSLLVQERIVGEEYIVNTVTVDGQHRLVSLMKYEKKALPNGSNIYVGMKFLPTMTPETYELVTYAFAVLDAIGIRQGPVHGEYMLDENGPVLMEVNCRCIGGSLSADYGDRVMGHHETDMALDSYLDPERVLAATDGVYKTKAYGMEKFFRASEDTTIMSTPLIGILPYLRSFHASALLTTATRNDMPKTVDLETTPGCIYMVHEDEGVLRQEYELLCELDANYFGLLYQKAYDPSLGALTYVTGEENELASFTMTQTQLKDYPLEDVYQYLKDIIRIVKPGGSIVVPKMVYDDFPYGAAGMIMIMKVMNCAVMRPAYGSDDMVFVNGKQA